MRGSNNYSSLPIESSFISFPQGMTLETTRYTFLFVSLVLVTGNLFFFDVIISTILCSSLWFCFSITACRCSSACNDQMRTTEINIRQWLTKTARECSCSKILKWSLFNSLHLDFQNIKSSLLNSHYVKLVPRKGRCVSIKILLFMSTVADANKGWQSGKKKELTRNQWDLKVNTRKLPEVRKNVSN